MQPNRRLSDGLLVQIVDLTFQLQALQEAKATAKAKEEEERGEGDNKGNLLGEAAPFSLDDRMTQMRSAVSQIGARHVMRDHPARGFTTGTCIVARTHQCCAVDGNPLFPFPWSTFGGLVSRHLHR